MGANSTQGVASLLFLVAFAFLSGAFFTGGGILYILAFLVCLGGSAALFLKAKPLEHMDR